MLYILATESEFDHITAFDTSDPTTAGGDLLQVHLQGDFFTNGNTDNDLQEAIDGGFIDFVDGAGPTTRILWDQDGGFGFVELAILEDITFVVDATSITLLADNFEFV